MGAQHVRRSTVAASLALCMQASDPTWVPYVCCWTAYEPVPQGEDTRLNYGVLHSNGKDVQLTNNGHTVQLSWNKSFMPDVTVAVRGRVE